MTEAEAQRILAHQFCLKKRHEMTVPNIKTCHGWWEADMLSLTRSYLTHEFEIKCSRSDWLKEYNQITNEESDTCKRKRHEAFTEQFNFDKDLKETPNYYWLVSGGGEYISDVPEYAGLITIKEIKGQMKLKVTKAAPRIHRFKASDHVILSMARSMNIKHWDYKIWE